MSENKTIKNFTAADIEKYWNKKLSPVEMHELEKAAMEDPFLADALEGYRYSTSADEELRTLAGKFEKKFSAAAPVVPMPRRKYAWLKIAAAIIVLAGAGIWIQQSVLQTKNEGSIANVEKAKEDKANEVSNPNDVVAKQLTDTANTTSVSPQTSTPKTEEKKAIITNGVGSFALSTIDSVGRKDNVANYYKAGDVALQRNDTTVIQEAEKRQVLNETEKVASDGRARLAKPSPDSIDAYFKKEGNVSAAMRANKFSDNQQSGILNNSFNYRVVDPQNKPVPFANVMNTRDNIGTYTDVRGYFNLVTSDSVLDVQVRSLGFNSENYRLVPSKQPNNLVLKEDATARNLINYNNQGDRVMSNVSRKDSAEVEEPEVGWRNYNTYAENNIKIPENVRAKNALNEVELSFDVDKTGQPVNIKVTKSSQCKECDEEAKRLLKEGPKWKRKGKKYKTTISISVDQK